MKKKDEYLKDPEIRELYDKKVSGFQAKDMWWLGIDLKFFCFVGESNDGCYQYIFSLKFHFIPKSKNY